MVISLLSHCAGVREQRANIVYGLIGSPPMNEESMVPYQIDTPGVEKTWRDRLGFFWLILMSLPGIIANRPAVLVDRTKQV